MIRNKDIRCKLGAAKIVDKMRKNRLRQPTYAPLRRCDYKTEAQGQRGRGRRRKVWKETLTNDFDYLDLMEDIAQNRIIYWNIRGLANSPTRHALCSMVRKHSPDFLCLAEPMT
ncbi:hypothetical protein DVH24_001903 [Malus domestica]|uniref:Endonuclease/exonuclease/phosphatase domain-containing protein n=1 Tax=Malus domestica TaxID=3750 RepID=A0A498I8K7_MALDO|nr:hypothetical protein DVH24_001903 [Malus domestica]